MKLLNFRCYVIIFIILGKCHVLCFCRTSQRGKGTRNFCSLCIKTKENERDLLVQCKWREPTLELPLVQWVALCMCFCSLGCLVRSLHSLISELIQMQTHRQQWMLSAAISVSSCCGCLDPTRVGFAFLRGCLFLKYPATCAVGGPHNNRDWW